MRRNNDGSPIRKRIHGAGRTTRRSTRRPGQTLQISTADVDLYMTAQT